VSELASAIDELAVENLDALDDAQLPDDLVELRRAIDRLEAEWLRRVAVFDRRGAWQKDGALSAPAWLRHRCRLSPGAAQERVTVARRLADDLLETAAALATGEIGYAHARMIAAATTEVRADTAAAAEPILVEAARSLDPARLGRVVAHWRHTVDSEAAIDDANTAFEHRRLHLSSTFQGMVVLDGQLDTEGGATVMTALGALTAPDRVGDPQRTPAQRRADALVELARRALDGGSLPTIGAERPHVTVTVDLTTLECRAGARAAELDWSGPVCAETARRLACDAGVSRVITAGASEPLDVGRRTPAVPPALRRAVIARDRHCVHPGCDRPPPWCDVHHRVHWVDGGPTALGNLELRCRSHHRMVHEGRRQPTRRRARTRTASRSPPERDG